MKQAQINQDTIQKLKDTRNISDSELAGLFATDIADDVLLSLFSAADEVRRKVYGNKVFVRGLIEISNYCKNDCYYCGIRKSNMQADRYRLTKEQILNCCESGYALGYRTFVLQGGEDLYFDDDRMCDIVSAIRGRFDDCAITLSVGEKSKESYKAYFDAGANRYLLRHETACSDHYAKLHPSSMSLENRKRCLSDLKEIGYQVGAGFMVGSPFQTVENLVADIRFLQDFDPDMIGIGPFVKHEQTPFASYPNGSALLTVRILAILRLMMPHVLLPATTALATLLPDGRELGLKAGANVIMPNLSPVEVRGKYSLYQNKAAFGSEDARLMNSLKQQIESYGYEIVTDVGNVKR